MSIYRDRCEELEYEIRSIKEENEKLRRDIESAKEIIKNADKVEIIRCKDCLFHSNKETTISKLYPDIRYCEYLDVHTKNGGYCYFAKERG